jgi:Rrf2 family protein
MYEKEMLLIAVLIDLSSCSKVSPITLKKLAARNHVTVNYLETVFPHLREREIVKSVMGNRGGYQLGPKGLQTRVSDIFIALDKFGERQSDTTISQPVIDITNTFWKQVIDFSLSQVRGLNLADFIKPADETD